MKCGIDAGSGGQRACSPLGSFWTRRDNDVDVRKPSCDCHDSFGSVRFVIPRSGLLHLRFCMAVWGSSISPATMMTRVGVGMSPPGGSPVSSPDRVEIVRALRRWFGHCE
jgi:hypothetical protein